MMPEVRESFDNPPITQVCSGINGNSILQSAGYYKTNWPAQSGMVIPQGLSVGGWTVDNRGFVQQTFLGASIRSFSMNGGFGDSASTLSVELINDEYNKSDGTAQGSGDDVYHNGNYDKFAPPIVGSPVFFKFGQNFASVEQAYKKTFIDIYNSGFLTGNGIPTTPAGDFDHKTLAKNVFVDIASSGLYDYNSYLDYGNERRGQNHIVFGGILQSYLQNKGPNGNPLFSVQVVDPREILSNVVVLLNNYTGSTFNTQNMFNIYGFLEYNPTKATLDIITQALPSSGVLTKTVGISGISYTGEDIYYKDATMNFYPAFAGKSVKFPITGTGFSRRGPQGIPYYRVAQAMNAMMETEFELPSGYKEKGFSSKINFRGYNYLVDFSGLPTLPKFYFIDLDQTNMLDLCMEICDVTSTELFVTLLPIIDHPACKFAFEYNKKTTRPQDLIAGIIRVDAIDRSQSPTYGSVKRYIDNLDSMGIRVENQDIGYELSNITTDKFIVGAQEVDMICLSANADRDIINVKQRRGGGEDSVPPWSQWTLETQLEQQILPYYGLLGNRAITIPKGWGAYQQILLDTTGLNANGVGSYYVATEMELRCASVSYDCWKNFLRQYNDIYLESIEGDDTYQGTVLMQTPNTGDGPPSAPNISNNYAVTVPRSVFDTYASPSGFGTDSLPISACNPPYGYPLYYKRMTKLGIPEGGLTKLQSRITRMIQGSATIRGAESYNYEEIKNSQLEELENIEIENTQLSTEERAYYNKIKTALESTPPNIALLNEIEDSLHGINAILPRLAKKGTENALKVYEFLKKIADENLGKKFLVKIPNKVNLKYNVRQISWKDNDENTGEYVTGPFGFKPRPVSSGVDFEFSTAFYQQLATDRSSIDGINTMKSYLNSSGINTALDKYTGAIKCNYSPISEKFEFNYSPTNLGGYFSFDLYQNTLSASDMQKLIPSGLHPRAVVSMLCPQDATNFLNENGRLSPYVRFDNSQDLDLGQINAEDFTQQLITPSGMVPDLCEFLDNAGTDEYTFRDADADRRDNEPNKPKQCAFVKCSIDDNFYMPPKMSVRSIDVYGAAESREKVSKPRKIFIPCSGLQAAEGPPTAGGQLPPSVFVPGTGVYVDSFRYTEVDFYPTTEKSEPQTASRLDFNKKYVDVLRSNIIKTDIEDLDTNHIYALITLPNKLIPTKDTRYRDSINQKDNTYDIKHYLTMDVVKGLPEFENPGYAASGDVVNITKGDPSCSTYSAEARSVAWIASKKAKSSLQFGFPSQIQVMSPSPVVPDLVVIPLISNERCYGPWISSQLDVQSTLYSNIGGRVEFIKDENLSPWNYAGYDLMHEAGRLQAEFSNSLLLFSERGGFVVPAAPSGSLGKALIDGGPLITSMQVDVSEAGIKTTYKLDLYTSSFGKLQKQKQDLISKISRERQKLRDERNNLIRKGIGKGQTSINLIGAINLYGNNGTAMPPPKVPNDHIVASVLQYQTSSYSQGAEVSGIDSLYSSSMQSEQDICNTANLFDSITQRAQAMYNAGASRMSDLFIPYSNEPHHPNMPNMQYVDFRATNRLYENEDLTMDDNEYSSPA